MNIERRNLKGQKKPANPNCPHDSKLIKIELSDNQSEKSLSKDDVEVLINEKL